MSGSQANGDQRAEHVGPGQGQPQRLARPALALGHQRRQPGEGVQVDGEGRVSGWAGCTDPRARALQAGPGQGEPPGPARLADGRDRRGGSRAASRRSPGPSSPSASGRSRAGHRARSTAGGSADGRRWRATGRGRSWPPARTGVRIGAPRRPGMASARRSVRLVGAGEGASGLTLVSAPGCWRHRPTGPPLKTAVPATRASAPAATQAAALAAVTPPSICRWAFDPAASSRARVFSILRRVGR